MRLWMVRMSVVAIVGLLAVFFSPSWTATAATCSGSGCNGQSPSGTGCSSGAVQIAANTSSNLDLKLYGAAACYNQPNGVYYSYLWGANYNSYYPKYVAIEATGFGVKGGRNLSGSGGVSNLWSFPVGNDKRGYGTYTVNTIGYSIYTQFVQS